MNPINTLKLRTCLLFVNEIEQSKNYYAEFLDLSPVEDLVDFASFQIGEQFINLHLADGKSPLSTGGCVCYLHVENLEYWIKKATDIGGTIWRGPLKVSDKSTICQILDPFGNVIGLESNKDTN